MPSRRGKFRKRAKTKPPQRISQRYQQTGSRIRLAVAAPAGARSCANGCVSGSAGRTMASSLRTAHAGAAIGPAQQPEHPKMRSKSASARQEVAQERANARPARFAALVITGVSLSSAQAGTQTNAACSTYGNWIDGSGKAIDSKDLVRDLAGRSGVVLLGESHTSPDHHAWQMQTVAALRGRTDNMVLGFESFPRRLPGVLDDWVAGKP